LSEPAAAQATLYAFEHLQSSAPPDPRAPQQAIARAHAEAEAIRRQARQEGFEQGRAEGVQQGAAAVESASAALSQVLTQVLDQREQMVDALCRDAVDLALDLAAKVVHGTLEVQPQRVVDVVRDALRPIADRRRITVLVDPDDLEIVTSTIEELRAQAGGIELCEVQADRRVGRGGAIVRTSEGEVDACVQAQLQKAQEIVAAELGPRPQP
jgi:flagellar biosynthesis/type III secretory pathway protein FliH